MTVEPDLARLATAHGVATAYEDQLRRPVVVSRDAVVGVLAALGVDASSPTAVREALRTADNRTTTPGSVVLRQTRGTAVPVGGPALLRLEDGSHRSVPTDGGRVTLPAGLPLGWHRLETDHGDIPVVVTPERVSARTRRGWGWMTQLYALRSASSWGVGDVADLRELTRWTAARGGDVMLVNPLHAVAPVLPIQPSPYYPGSRRWTNPLYLRVEDTAWYLHADADVRARVDALRPAYDADRIDRDTAWTAKLAALELLWQHRPEPGAAARRYLLPPDDDDLWTFATWCALCELHGPDWRQWPAELRRPDAPAVGRARHELGDRVLFFAWLQLLAEEHLGWTQHLAKDAGMDVGIVHDLAVGADPGGADAWMLQDALALTARFGAPPDAFNQQGQDWGMPPWHPRGLERMGYAPLRDMLRAVLRLGGGVRIDHVLGLFRLWWIPADAGPRDGAYVRYDADAMLGVIALEVERAGGIVVGEDLGTVPHTVRDMLRERGVLGSSVLWFERMEVEPGALGPLAPAADWREAAMASVTTHDLPTARGWLRGDHLRVRTEHGLVDDPDADEQTWKQERAELLDHLVAAGVIPSADLPEEELALALHHYLTITPSRYVLAAPADAVGDVRQPNLPGTVDDYPNWRLPVADPSGRPMLLEALLRDARTERLAATLRDGVR